MPFKEEVASRGQIRKEIEMNYIKIKCVHRCCGQHFINESEDDNFVFALNEIVFIRPVEYPLNMREREQRWQIGFKFWNSEERTIIVSKKCGEEIMKTLTQKGELKEIEE